MKKLLAISIAFLYLAVSSGLALEIHHCMGEIADVSILPSKADKCGNCGMEKQANACCKDELKFVKLQDVYKLSHSGYKIVLPESTIINEHFLQDQYADEQVIHIRHNNHSPPYHSDTSLYLLHCVFRI